MRRGGFFLFRKWEKINWMYGTCMYIYMYGNKSTGCRARVEQAILCQCHIKEGKEKQKYSNLLEISL